MKTVRRLYFYAVALISIEIVVWGLINLLRSIVDETIGGQAEALAQALALVLVGMPIFLFHWLWTQRASARDPEEQTAGLRAVFFYAILIGTLIPLVQNILALVDRLLLDAGHLELSRAIFEHAQSWQDSLIAILINGAVAAYFWNVLRGEWARLADKETFADVRRLYRYIWLLYSLLMTIFGAQQILRYLFDVLSGMLGDVGSEALVNGIALLVVGAPVWYYTWHIIQTSLADPAEHDSNLRLAILYLLSLGGVITVLTTTAIVLQILLSQAFGEGRSAVELINDIGGPISVGVPLGVVWAYYGYWLNRHIESIGDPVRQAGMKRVYFYILSVLGLGGALIGIAALVKFIIDYFTGHVLALDAGLRSNLSSAISLIVAWLPLWLASWRPMQAEAFAAGSAGDHARRSVVRRAYLYLALFTGVVGGMTAAVALMYELLITALSGDVASDFAATALNDLQLVILFAIVLVYHLWVMRRDGQATADVLAKKQGDFKLLVVDGDQKFGDSVKAAMQKVAPSVPVTIASGKVEGEFNAAVLSGSTAVNAPEWLRSFRGPRIVVPDEAPGLIWAGGVREDAVRSAAQAVRQLAEGQPVQQKRTGSGWMVVVYIAAALFVLQLFFGLLAVVIGSLAHF